MTDGPALDIKAVIALCSKLDLEESSTDVKEMLLISTVFISFYIPYAAWDWNVYSTFTMDLSQIYVYIYIPYMEIM